MGFTMFASQPPNTVLVRVVEQPVESTSVGDIVVGALGLTGVMLLAALLMGAVLGAGLIAFKRLRARLNLGSVPDSDAMRVTPGATR